MKYLKIIILTAIILILIRVPYSYGQVTPAAISTYTVLDPNAVDITGQPLLTGGTYTFKFTVEIGATLNDDFLMSTNLERVKDVYWSLESDYEGIDKSTWTPGSSAISFKALKGNAVFSLTGRVPAEYTLELLPNDRILHFIRSLPIITVLLVSTGEVVEQKSENITDQVIGVFEDVLVEKRDLLTQTSVEPRYKELAQKVLAQSEGLAEAGYVQEATDLLNSLPATGAVLPPPPSDQNLLLFGSVGLVVVVAILSVLVARARSSSGFVRRRVDDEAGKLDLILVRAVRTDKALAEEIGSVKRRLEEIARS